MNLTRWQRPDVWNWDPLDQLSTLREEINQLFESPLSRWGGDQEFFNNWVPAMDLYEDKDNLIVKAEVPGMKKDEIDISLHDGSLIISGERKHEETEKGADTSRSERFFGRFQRSLSLPRPVDAGKASAQYRDGILTVTLPKTEESKPKQIEVKVS